MEKLTKTELLRAYNWACDRVSACRPSVVRDMKIEAANNVHSAYCKTADGKANEITREEFNAVANIALDVESNANRGTPRFELARTIFNKATVLRNAASM